MRIVTAIFADFAETFLGRPSRLMQRIGARTVLQHTLARAARIAGVDGGVLVVRPRDAAAAAAALAEAGMDGRFELLATDNGLRPRRGLFRAARKWNLESWRGGALTSTWFDEYVEPSAVAVVLERCAADAALCVDGHQAALDPTIGAALVAQQRTNASEARFTFSLAPPGIAGVVLTRAAACELLEQNTPLGVALGYRPEIPQGDPITRAGCLHIDARVAQSRARVVADTRRACELLTAAFAELGEECAADALCEWLRQPGHDRAGALPVEIELELTTDDPLPNTLLRPRGARVPTRQLTDWAALERVANELGGHDDRLVCLGGFGDPLLYAELPRALRLLRDAGILGVAVVTPLVALSDAALEALFEFGVDVLQVRVDATTPEAYRRVHGADEFGRVMSNIERVEALRRDRKQPAPIIVPSLTRCAATIGELEPFFDQWLRRTGSVLIEGYSDFGGRLPADTLLPTSPPIRRPCRRLTSRLMLLANGLVARCGEDLNGEQPIGSWFTGPLTDFWLGGRLGALREAHRALQFGAYPACGGCPEWFRP